MLFVRASLAVIPFETMLAGVHELIKEQSGYNK